jgi:hypothetical protein
LNHGGRKHVFSKCRVRIDGAPKKMGPLHVRRAQWTDTPLPKAHMHEVRTEIDIAAAPAQVWRVLTDFPAHTEWNPFVRSIQGLAQKDQSLTVSIQPAGGKSMTFKPTVLVADADRELRWRGRLLMPGIFDGEHYFQIKPNGQGGTTFVHGEKFSGLLIPFAKASLEGGTRAGFVAMNEALKVRAETAGS